MLAHGHPELVAVVGSGRAGSSFDRALRSVGWSTKLVGHTELDAVDNADLVLLCVPDGAIAETAERLPAGVGVVAHVAGSQPLAVLGDHEHVASVHPLMSLPDGATGASRLLDACTFAVDANTDHSRAVITAVVEALGGIAIAVNDDQRALYHATATIAANHLTALCGQVEALAALVGVPTAAYWKLMTTTLDNVKETSAAAALTGPAARGDWETIERHLRHLPPQEAGAYVALARRAAALAGNTWPDHLEATP